MSFYTLLLAIAVLGVFFFPGLVVMGWNGWRWWRWLTLALLAAWLVLVGWLAVLLTFPHWLDRYAERVLLERLIQAAKDGRTEVPLQELTDFKWYSVCRLGPYGYAQPREQDYRIFTEAVGEDRLDEFLLWLGEGDEMLVFGTPQGALMMKPVWWRLNKYTQSLWAFRHYRGVTGDRTYDVHFRFKPIAPGKVTSWEPLCYVPEQVFMGIKAE